MAVGLQRSSDWCCVLKFLHVLEIDQVLLAHTSTGKGDPSKNVNRENLQFGLKFSD